MGFSGIAVLEAAGNIVGKLLEVSSVEYLATDDRVFSEALIMGFLAL